METIPTNFSLNSNSEVIISGLLTQQLAYRPDGTAKAAAVLYSDRAGWYMVVNHVDFFFTHVIAVKPESVLVWH